VLERYERKQNLVMAERVRARLAEVVAKGAYPTVAQALIDRLVQELGGRDLLRRR
jgi:hypothetical protein